jgi:hypothetical protein
MSGRHHLLSAVALLATTVMMAVPALADGFSTGAGTSLVRGGAVLPHFDSSFPIETGNANAVPPLNQHLEISLSSPDHSVLSFLFSPRMISGDTYGFGQTVTGNYVGLAWNVFDYDQLFGNVALSGAVNREALDEPVQRLYGPLLSVHSTFEFGYAFNAQQNLSLALDHSGPTTYFGDYLRLRYGYHF